MVAVKDAFDPGRLLNPGVVIDGPGVTEHLRFGADYRGDGGWAPRLSYAAEGGFGPAVERCFGAGLCKKQTGTMCPPAAATRDEERSTRARANALQGVVCGAVPLGAIGVEEFRDVLGTCVACKACKTECPAGVDMAALKVEWLAELRAREGVPPLARGIGDFRRLAALASPVAPLVNALARTRAARLVTDRVGVAHERPLPSFARRPLTRRLARPRRTARRAGAAPARRAVLFVDCFIQYQEPGVGEALARLLAAAGVRLDPADAGCCGRTALSTGQIDKARAAASRALDRLHPLAAEGADILFVEPSCLSMARDDWTRLLPGDPRVAVVAAASRPGARPGRRPGRGGPPALPCRRPRPAAQPLPREGARVRRRHPRGAGGGAGPGGRGPGRRLLRHVRRLRLRGRPLRAQRRDGRAAAAAGRARRAARDGRAGDRHLVPVAGPRPQRPRRPAPARVPRGGSSPRRVAALRGGGDVYDGVVNWVILIAGVVGLAVAAYGLVALVRNAVRTRRYWDIAIAVAVAVGVVVLLIAFGDRLIR